MHFPAYWLRQHSNFAAPRVEQSNELRQLFILAAVGTRISIDIYKRINK